MKSKIDKNNSLTEKCIQWKKDQAIISLTIDEMINKAKGHKLIVENKVDGQTTLLEYKNENAKFGTLGGRIIWDIPLTDEIEKIFKEKKIKYAIIVGEMAAYKNNKILPFDKSESIIKNPQANKNLISWHPYQIIQLDEQKFNTTDFDVYTRIWPRLKEIFKRATHIFPVKDYVGDVSAIKKAWEKLVLKQKNEGIVVRTDENRTYKCKPTFTYDLVVIAVGSKKGKNWPKKMIGNTLMAFMDEEHIFRVAGEIGTGWNEKEKKELFNWAQKNKVGEDDTYVWVKPQRIIQVQWERSNIKHNPAFKYERGKYEKLEKRPVGTIVKPRFIRYRTDKSVNPKDLRLTQIPNWEKIKKMASRIASAWLSAGDEDEMIKVVPKGWPKDHWIPVCKSCAEGKHLSYGTNHMPPGFNPQDKSEEYLDSISRYTCKNVGMIDGKRHQCNCSAANPGLLEELKNRKA